MTQLAIPRLAAAAAILLLAGSPAAEAQVPVQSHRIGFLSPLPGVPEPPTLRAFREGLRELGYVEGGNILVETRFAEGRQELYPGLIADLLQRKVEVLVIGADIAVLTAKKTTASVPIVFAGVSDPVNSGIVTNLARPGGNITGVTFGIGGEGFGGKWVELLKEAVPGISRVAVLKSSADPQTPPLMREIRTAAGRLNIRLQEFDAINPAALDRAFAAIAAGSAQGIVVCNSPFFASNRVKLAEFAASRRLPAMYFFKLFADAGGLMSYGGSVEESYRRAAAYVDKILKGARPGDLPVEQPTRVELVINLKAARALGLAIPQSLLLRADQVIE